MAVGLLGPLTLTNDDRGIVVAAGRQRTLLATLALQVGRTVSLSALIDALWGEHPPTTAVKTLQTYVARLRRVLPHGWIVSNADGYALVVEPDTVDVWRLERAIAEGREAVRSFDYVTAAARFEAALSLWRGEPMDLGEQARGLAAAARLRELRLGTEEDLAEVELALGGGAELVPDLESAVLDQPLRERRWGQLMVALYRTGRQADALRAYQRARAALVEGLGIEPGPELRAVERAVIDRSPTLAATGAVGRGDRPLVSSIPTSVAAIASAPIVGRAAELDVLAATWCDVVAGRRRVVVAHGEPGIGKTRLVGEAALLAHRANAVVLFGRCDREALTAYQAIVDALRPLLRTLSDASLASVPAWETTELARLVPELGDRLGREAELIVNEPGARHRLFAAVGSFLGRHAGTHPIVLVIDDLQWIDRAGAGLLRHLVRALPDRFWLLATHWSGDAESDAQLDEVVTQLPPDAQVTLLAVRPLDRGAILELTGGDRDEADELHAATNGSPLYVTELLRFRAATGRLPDRGELPPSIRHVIGRRIVHLGCPARRLVEAAAVAGNGAAITDLASATGLTTLDAIDGVEEALAAHVLREPPEAPGTVVFTHDLVRVSVLQDLSAVRRSHLHRSIAEAIIRAAGRVDGGRAAEVAHHLAATAAPDDAEVARWAMQAARHAMSQFAFETAITQFELALAHVDPNDAVQRACVLADLGHASRVAGLETSAEHRSAEARLDRCEGIRPLAHGVRR